MKYQIHIGGVHRYDYHGAIEEVRTFLADLHAENGDDSMTIHDENGVLVEPLLDYDTVEIAKYWDGMKLFIIGDDDDSSIWDNSDDDYESRRDAQLIESMIRAEQDSPEGMLADLNFIRDTYGS